MYFFNVDPEKASQIFIPSTYVLSVLQINLPFVLHLSRLEAKAGWQTFMKRRTAVAKINSLPDATRDQLESHNDVCAICYQVTRIDRTIILTAACLL